MKTTLACLAAAALFAASAPAMASTFVFDDLSDSYTIELANEDIDGLTALLTLSTFDIVDNGTDFVLNYTLENTSSGNTTSSRYIGFGGDVGADPFSASILLGPLFDELHSGQISSGTNVEFCAVTGNTCSGGGGEGLTIGQSTSGRLLFQTSNTTFSLTNLVVRSQAINTLDGIRGGSAILTEAGGFPDAVPEPSTWAMMILGFGAAGAMLRRHRSALSFARN